MVGPSRTFGRRETLSKPPKLLIFPTTGILAPRDMGFLFRSHLCLGTCGYSFLKPLGEPLTVINSVVT